MIVFSPHKAIYNEAVMANTANIELPHMQIQPNFAAAQISRYKQTAKIATRYPTAVFHAEELEADSVSGGLQRSWIRLANWLDSEMSEYRLEKRAQCAFDKKLAQTDSVLPVVPDLVHGGMLNQSQFTQVAWEMIAKELSHEGCVFGFAEFSQFCENSSLAS